MEGVSSPSRTKFHGLRAKGAEMGSCAITEGRDNMVGPLETEVGSPKQARLTATHGMRESVSSPTRTVDLELEAYRALNCWMQEAARVKSLFERADMALPKPLRRVLGNR